MPDDPLWNDEHRQETYEGYDTDTNCLRNNPRVVGNDARTALIK